MFRPSVSVSLAGLMDPTIVLPSPASGGAFCQQFGFFLLSAVLRLTTNQPRECSRCLSDASLAGRAGRDARLNIAGKQLTHRQPLDVHSDGPESWLTNSAATHFRRPTNKSIQSPYTRNLLDKSGVAQGQTARPPGVKRRNPMSPILLPKCHLSRMAGPMTMQ